MPCVKLFLAFRKGKLSWEIFDTLKLLRTQYNWSPLLCRIISWMCTCMYFNFSSFVRLWQWANYFQVYLMWTISIQSWYIIIYFCFKCLWKFPPWLRSMLLWTLKNEGYEFMNFGVSKQEPEPLSFNSCSSHFQRTLGCILLHVDNMKLLTLHLWLGVK